MDQLEKARKGALRGRPTRLARALASGVVFSGAWLPAAVAHAGPPSGAASEQLLRGETVVFRQSYTRGEKHYLGGVAYTLVDAPAQAITDMLAREETWRRILPRTRSAKQIGESSGDALIELTQGTALIQATYTIFVRREPGGVKFWMDPRRAHDIEDAWGFLRAEPLPDGRSLVCFGVLIDMGSGLLRDLFEERVRALALSVPDRVRSFVDERNAAGQRASR